jgi:hypothetical protein
MRHTMVIYTVKPGYEEENAALVRAVFEELAETRPAGLRYAVFYLREPRQFARSTGPDGHVARSKIRGTTRGVDELRAHQSRRAPTCT